MARPYTVFLLALVVSAVGVFDPVTASFSPPAECFLCGTPPLTLEQLASIDPERVEQMRQYIMNGGNSSSIRPIMEGDPMYKPMVELTPAQRLSLEFKYPPDAAQSNSARQKRNAIGSTNAVCQEVGSNAVLLTINVGENLVECIPGALSSASGCSSTGGCAGDRCCLESICITVYCLVFKLQGTDLLVTFSYTPAMINRCTCVNSFPLSDTCDERASNPALP